MSYYYSALMTYIYSYTPGPARQAQVPVSVIRDNPQFITIKQSDLDTVIKGLKKASSRKIEKKKSTHPNATIRELHLLFVSKGIGIEPKIPIPPPLPVF